MRRVLVACGDVPSERRSGGSGDMMRAIDAFVRDGWRVTLVCEVAAPADLPQLARLAARGIESWAGPNCAGIGDAYLADRAELIEEGEFDLALIQFWYLAERYLPVLADVSPQTRTIVDSVDVALLRRGRQARLLGDEQTGGDALDTARELRAYGDADVVLAISERERAAIDVFCTPRGGVVFVPKTPVVDALEDSPPFAQRRGIVVLGFWGHQPNVDGLGVLLDDVLPALDDALRREHPLYVCGFGLPDDLAAKARATPHVYCLGWVPDVASHLRRSRVMAAPLRYGAGIKSKIVDACAAGLPVVTTAIGAEGLGEGVDDAVLLAEQPDAFAAQLTRALTDEAWWSAASRAGRAWAADEHAPQRARDALGVAVDAALSVPRTR